jgi:hypothetical protein
MTEYILFVVIISLLLLHEMDAIRAREWKMFIVLKDMSEETAYKVFLFIHFPLYIAAFYVLCNESMQSGYILKVSIDIFLIGHAILHYGFRNHNSNGFSAYYSKAIIYSLFALALAHLCILLGS